MQNHLKFTKKTLYIGKKTCKSYIKSLKHALNHKNKHAQSIVEKINYKTDKKIGLITKNYIVYLLTSLFRVYLQQQNKMNTK